MNHDPTLPVLLFAASAWFLHPLFKLAWRKSLRRNVHMVITAEEFRFRGWAGWRSFDRKLQHRFALILHDKARRERDRHELEERKAQQSKKIIKKRRYYQDSYHLAFEYVGQRNDVSDDLRTPGSASRAGTAEGRRRGDDRACEPGRRHAAAAPAGVGRTARRDP